MSAFETAGLAVERKGLLARLASVPADEIRAYVYILANDAGELIVGTNGKRKDDLLAMLAKAARDTLEAEDGPLGEPA